MKKLFVFSLLFFVGACAQGSIYKGYDQDCNSHFYSGKSCPTKKEVKKEEPRQPEKFMYIKKDRSNVASHWLPSGLLMSFSNRFR